MARSTSLNRFAILSTGVAATALMLVAPVHGQSSKLEPTFGVVTEQAGFGSNTLAIQAGGAIEADALGAGCVGFIADAPDIVFDYGGNASVTIEATSQVDTTIVVETPGGQFLCNDDFDELNPGVETAFNEPGRYAIWVGTFDPLVNDLFPDADVTFTEAGAAPDGLNVDSEASFGNVSLSDLSNGFTTTLPAGGTVEASATDDACAGFIADVPDLAVDYVGGSEAMAIDVTSDADTTLLVVTPSGEVRCSDDAVDFNPGMVISDAEQGRYALFVGTFNPVGSNALPDATLTISQADLSVRLDGRGGQDPIFGGTNLVSGFGTYTVDLQAGGNLRANDFGSSCSGFVEEAPDYRINYTGTNALEITAISQSDTTMVVMAPGDRLFCNDDFQGLNAGLITPEGFSGELAIWVGTFDPIENGDFPDASLAIREISDSKAHPQDAIRSKQLTAGFTPDPFTTQLAAGGPIDASTVDDICVGFIASGADFVLDYTSGDWPLRFSVTSDVDTTMLVRAPSGEVLCNDDSDGLNPALAIASPTSGRYEVYIGTFNANAVANATFAITELVDQKELHPGAIIEASVTTGMTREDYDLLAGGSFQAVDQLGASCVGFVAADPDFTAQVDVQGIDLEFVVNSAEDTTLAVRVPNGRVMCDDDSAGNLNPLILVPTAPAGTYEVWLGTFASVGNAPATLSIRDINAPLVPAGGKK
ncbi:MAG: hypothetical protein AAF590_08785 [Pseudomonadota bacterium]